MSNRVPDLIIYDGVKITKFLVIERVQYLVNCGGVLPRGQLHKWRQREQIILIYDEIEQFEDSIGVTKIISSMEELYTNNCLCTMKWLGCDFECRESIESHNIKRQSEGMTGNHRRTIERKFSAKRSSQSITTRTGEILTLGDIDKLEKGKQGYICPGCQTEVTAEFGFPIRHCNCFWPLAT